MARVELALVRRSGARCAAWNGIRFLTRACARARTSLLPATLTGSRWSLKVAPLRAGTYELRVRAVDGAGHRSAVAVRALRLR